MEVGDGDRALCRLLAVASLVKLSPVWSRPLSGATSLSLSTLPDSSLPGEVGAEDSFPLTGLSRVNPSRVLPVG